MGIFGFGTIRDKFTEVIELRCPYAACFDVTPMVVHAIRNNVTEADFMAALQHRIANCKEMRFLRSNPPTFLRYTLDNRSPRAKRQTQLQRIVESKSLLARMMTTTTVAREEDGGEEDDAALPPSTTIPAAPVAAVATKAS